jgi:hypothetical protein
MIIVASPVQAVRFDFSGYRGKLIPFRFVLYQGQWNGLQPVTLGPTQDLTNWSFTLTIKSNAGLPDSQSDYEYQWTTTGPNGGLVAADVPAAISLAMVPGPYRYNVAAVVISTDPQELVWGYYQHQAT